jgi:hypothetical protein
MQRKQPFRYVFASPTDDQNWLNLEHLVQVAADFQ